MSLLHIRRLSKVLQLKTQNDLLHNKKSFECIPGVEITCEKIDESGCGDICKKIEIYVSGVYTKTYITGSSNWTFESIVYHEIPEPIIDIINQWSKKELIKHKKEEKLQLYQAYENYVNKYNNE